MRAYGQRESFEGPVRVCSTGGVNMTLCPIALAVHCTHCPIVKVCPAKRSLGDYGTFVPTPVVPPSGAKADSDATTGKIDRGEHG
jgi:hypothetical protein